MICHGKMKTTFLHAYWEFHLFQVLHVPQFLFKMISVLKPPEVLKRTKEQQTSCKGTCIFYTIKHQLIVKIKLEKYLFKSSGGTNFLPVEILLNKVSDKNFASLNIWTLLDTRRVHSYGKVVTMIVWHFCRLTLISDSCSFETALIWKFL